MAGAMTLREAADKVAAAIEVGQLAAQQAPAGHAIFAALADAAEAKDWIDGQIPFWSNGDSPALPNVSAKVDDVVSAVYDAMATLRVDPDVALAPTVFPAPPAGMSSGEIALGGALLLAVGFWAFRRYA